MQKKNIKTRLTVTETAALVGVSRQTVYRMLHDGTLSRTHDKLIDLSEIFRVFPHEKYNYVTPDGTSWEPPIDTADAQNVTNSPDFVTHLQDENAYLKAEIERLHREKREVMDMFQQERERCNTLMAALPDMSRKKRRWWFW